MFNLGSVELTTQSVKFAKFQDKMQFHSNVTE